jgi:hypothetical protein
VREHREVEGRETTKPKDESEYRIREERREKREERRENREQRTENREQRTENREQRTENREQRTENRGQYSAQFPGLYSLFRGFEDSNLSRVGDAHHCCCPQVGTGSPA